MLVKKMSLPESESSISKSFSELLNYVSSLGNHINKIYDRLEKIDTNLDNIKDELTASIENNTNELESVKEAMITKSEFNDILQKLDEPFKQFSPPKTPEQPHEEFDSSPTEQEEEQY